MTRSSPTKTFRGRLGRTAYFESGRGRPVLFLHGFPDDPGSFAEQVRFLEEKGGFRCLVPYLPGYDPSSPPAAGHFSLLAISEMLEEFLQGTCSGEEIAIFGHDWGALIAQILAARSGASGLGIERLILGAVPPVRTVSRNINLRQIHRSRYMLTFQLPGVVRRIRAGGLRHIRTLWARWSPGLDPQHPQLASALETLGRGDTLRNAILYYRYMLNPALALRAGRSLEQRRLLFANINLPCLVVHGADDGCMGTEMFAGSESECVHPESKLVTIPGAGHFFHIEKPDSFSRLLEGFLSDSGQSGRGSA